MACTGQNLTPLVKSQRIKNSHISSYSGVENLEHLASEINPYTVIFRHFNVISTTCFTEIIEKIIFHTQIFIPYCIFDYSHFAKKNVKFLLTTSTLTKILDLEVKRHYKTLGDFKANLDKNDSKEK